MYAQVYGRIEMHMQLLLSKQRKLELDIIIILAGMAVFNMAGYLIEERSRWPTINASPRGQCSI